jgi:UDP-N-acetylglucosamine 2-epimerase (non-hydrolysing)
MSKKVVFVAGARPNLMKIAPILRVLEERGGPLQAELVHTGQHYDKALSEIFFEQLGIQQPDVHLEVGSGTHGVQTAKVLAAFEEYLLRQEAPPAGVVVVGDVNSTMAATLAAVKLGIPVAHVEAGLRSFDRTMPEEVNRLVTDALADLLFVSEPSGVENLRREGVSEQKIHHVGNVMIDTLVRELPEARELSMSGRLGLDSKSYVLVTLHRPSNVDREPRLAQLVDFLSALAGRIAVVFPVHPRTKKQLEAFGLIRRLLSSPGLVVADPLGYRENLSLMADARFVLTDSGGIQEETTYLRVPCITFRPNTERPVTVSEGTNTLITGQPRDAWETVSEVLDNRYKSGGLVWGWDGRAAERIVDVLERRC